MGVPRPGLLIGSSLMVLFAMLFLSLAVHWFSVMLLLLGIVGVAMSFVPDDPVALVQVPAPAGSMQASASPQSPAPREGPVSRVAADPKADQLRERLHALDQMLVDGVVSPVEHKRKRQQLLDAWALPPAPPA